MLDKLFPRKIKVHANQPHPLKVNFATQIIPAMLAGNQLGFLNLMISEQANDLLRARWTKVGHDAVGKRKTPDPAQLSVHPFRQENYFFLLFTFPRPQQDKEPYFALAAYDPPASGEWNEDHISTAATHYFICCAQGESTDLWELTDDTMKKLGPGPEPTDQAFAEAIMEHLFRS